MIELTIDGNAISVPDGTTLWQAARTAGIEIPTLCHDPRVKAAGVCRMCVVDIGARTLVASCVRPCEPGMVVHTSTDEIESDRRLLLELMMADQPTRELDARQSTTADNKLFELADRYHAAAARFESNGGPERDDSSPVIAVDHQACILCDLCIRACDDLQSNEVLGRSGKGYGTRVAFDLDAPMGQSSCVSCGECAAVCPTGALVDKPVSAPLRPREALAQVDSVCPYCGVGCALSYQVDEQANEIVFAEGRENPSSQKRLCVKGRYGWDYAQHHQRLVVPLIRRDENYPKGPLSRDVRGKDEPGKGRGGRRRKAGGLVDYAEVLPAFREASWDEALDLVARRLGEIRDTSGPDSLAGFGSAKCSNEEAYLFQKLVRAAFGTNNVDHCTRLCHASSVAALLEGIGSGAVTTTYADVANADAALVAGANPTSNHPVAATFFKQAQKRGTKLIFVDPRRGDLADHSDHYCKIRPGTDVAFYNAMMCTIIEEGLVDRDYVERHTKNYAALEALVSEYPPERVAPICGIEAQKIREVAIDFASAKQAVIFWGMGISQHTHGTDNARCLIALALLTGNIGKPGSGLHPLRGQNNVQGASDAGLIPMMYPDYQSVEDPQVREKFARAWGRELSAESGLTVVEIVQAALAGDVRGMYIMGENPFLSDPDTNKVREALGSLDFLVVQDIFLTETAEFADVILPASAFVEKLGSYTNTDRRVQIGRPAVKMPGQARLDWEILCEVSTRLGYPMHYDSPEQIFAEFAALTSSYATLSHANLGDNGKLWPNPDPDNEDGPVVLFGAGFPTADGRAKFVPAHWSEAPELPDAEFPLILNTGRILEHWHTGSMTRRTRALDELAPEAFVGVHPADAASLGVDDGDWVQVTSRRGSVTLRARIEPREIRGAVFIPFHFREAGANLLTMPELDPDGKIPGFKFCAVKLARISSAQES
jgi:formate dehydrogenase major subunit